MTRNSYHSYVNSVAKNLLQDLECREWIQEHFLAHHGSQESTFTRFCDEKEEEGYYIRDRVQSFCDAWFKWNGWRGAIEVLQATKQNPDDVDSGVYEGAPWERILGILAFECFLWDVNERLNERFEETVEKVESGERRRRKSKPVPFPTTDRQIGYWPKHRCFEWPRCDAVDIWGNENLFKIQVSEKTWLCIEGEIDNVAAVIVATRIYIQGHKDSDADMKVDEALRTATHLGLRDRGFVGEEHENN